MPRPKKKSDQNLTYSGRSIPDYNKEIADSICELVATGENIDRLAGKKGFPSKATIYGWLRHNNDFADEYARARKTRADFRSDRLDDICRKVEEGILDPQQARVIADIEKWQAGKERPAYYGDRTKHEHEAGGDLADFLAEVAKRNKKVTDKS